MSTKRKKAGRTNNQYILTRHNINFWVMSGVLLFFFFIMPFQRGLFNIGDPQFEIPILYSFVIGSVLLFCLSIQLFRARAAETLETPFQYLIWAIPFVYFISMFGAASAHYSYFEFLVWIFYAIMFMVAFRISSNKDGSHIAFYIYMGTAAVIVLFGMMNWFGDASLWGLLPWDVYKDAAMHASGDVRLTSVFQYANTYAAYLIAFLFACLATAAFSKNKYIVLSASFMFVPAFISFVLTLSRGGWLTFPLVLLLILPFIKFSKQIQACFHFVVGVIASVLILPFVNSIGLKLQVEHTQGTAFKAWIILLGVSLAAAIVSTVFQLYVAPKLEQKLQRLDKRKFNGFLLPVSGVIVGALGISLLLGNTGILNVLPENIASRVENINFNQHSVLERGTFYRDTIEIWKDYPVAGAGGGAWQALYEKYQNNPYTSALAHSFFFQMLAEAGTLGILALFALLIIVYYLFIRAFVKKEDDEKLIPFVWFIVSTSILVHSVLDFNMNYVYISALVFFALGGMLASSGAKSYEWQQKLLRSKWKLIAPSVLIVGSFVFFIATTISISGYNSYKNAIDLIKGSTVQEALTELDKAIERGGHPEYANMKLQILSQAYEQTWEDEYVDDAKKTLEKVMKKEPFYEKFIYRQLEFNSLLHNDEASTVLLEASLDKFPWEITLYEELASVQFRRSIAALEQNEISAAKELLQSIMDLRDKILDKAVVLEELPEEQLQGRPFGITPKLALAIGQAYYVLGDYETAVNYLATAWNAAFVEQKDITAAVYYSAGLQKLNRPYEEVNNALFAAFPDDQEHLQQQIDGLIMATPLGN